MGDAIATRELTKFYGKTRGIEGLTMTVAEGEIFGFIGPNGAGKTTTIRSLMGLIYPTAGQAALFGKPLPRGGGELYRRVGYLPGEVNYYPEMTGREVLEYAAGFYDHVDQKWIGTLIERLRLDPAKRVRGYSHGNRKKLGIIQALLHKPSLAVLDEPTSGLDPLIKLEFFHLMQELNQAGMTIFFSTHVLEEVERICTRVGIIKNGQLIQVSPVDQIPGRQMKILTFSLAGDKALHDALADWGPGNMESVEGKPGYFQVITDQPVNRIVTRLAGLDLIDLKITDPSIEELFLAIYGPDRDKEADRA